MAAFDRVILLVADGVGCGGAPDAAAYGDAGADTLGNLSRRVGGLRLPNLGALGLGHLTPIEGVPPTAAPTGAYGALREASAGKDTTTGHWEMTGYVTTTPWTTFGAGIPADVLVEMERLTGRTFMGGQPASGTAIIEAMGPAHLATGALIAYTSADSVIQIAAHDRVAPAPVLWEICAKVRPLADRLRVGRVIARPFVGEPGRFLRTYDRRDFSAEPPGPTLLDGAKAAGLDVVAIGKIEDIFAGRGITRAVHTEGNRDGLARTLDIVARGEPRRGIVFVNLVDFDMVYGHRNDAPGFAAALADLDAWLPALQARLGPRDLVMLSADHGNDPTKQGTDHTRERVPLLAFGPSVRPSALGERATFADLGQTAAAALGLPALAAGTSFLDALAGGSAA